MKRVTPLIMLVFAAALCAQQSRVHAIDGEGDFTAQLTELYTKVKPEKLGDVPHLVQKYKGAEKKLLRSIRKKYGIPEPSPSPPPSPPTPEAKVEAKAEEPAEPAAQEGDVQGDARASAEDAATDAETDDWRAQLFLLYETHNPTKMDQIEYLLKKYKGNEAKLIESIQAKYEGKGEKAPQETPPAEEAVLGPTPSPCTTHTVGHWRAELLQLYRVHNPTKVDNVDGLLEKYAGREEELLRTARLKYNVAEIEAAATTAPTGEKEEEKKEEPPAPLGVFHAQLHNLYTQYNPAKVADIPFLLKKYAGKEAALITRITEKYTKQNNAKEAQQQQPSEEGDWDWAAQLNQIYEAAGKLDRIEGIPDLIKKYAGHEEKLLETARKKYGL